MKPTIYDIAKVAGVSTATVSKVINNKGRISDRTKEKIYQIMDEMRYRPNVLASALKGKCTYQIALLIPDMDNPIYAQYLKHIEDRGQELGFSIVMCSTDNNPEKEAKHITLLRQKKVDGFIIASKFSNEELLSELLQDEVPVVLFAHERPEMAIDSVTVDDYWGGFMATEHLISLKHEKIGVIADDSISCRERIRGYTSALRSAGLSAEDNMIVITRSKMADAEIAAGTLLDLTDRPTAIFGCNDIMAIGVMQAARKRHLTVPDELSVIGFDNTQMCTIVVPELSSIAMPVHELGKKAIDMLIDKIERQANLKQNIKMPPQLVIRNSTSKKK
ncbi:LacI family DNA-binding transcriptional regulator [Paenibacillus validus]|uniref:LacI family DNA-binding transcriptional regulator n=1 Tax=Paenibacillus validus TaxID=44253 RepID=A0A7X3CRW9_9BACL|nr:MULTISPECIES: LacI family DNA-binding transcriptional regulator [Paenibacillus]MED4599346.1 LacI family DNA-binding transcriptional regulator [Paenibacillus validus]MED4606342.1 LacI family DNA-binding transcriptional regulator [Paenibacillus validus]MUG70136.1 LacI family DNA-binding transcriptional regulator [Paenibacillus validus]